MAVHQRLKTALNFYKISQSRFSDLEKINKSTLSKILSGESENFRIEILQGFANRFPDLNMRWVLTGEGEMILKSEDEKNQLLDLYQVVLRMESEIIKIKKNM